MSRTAEIGDHAQPENGGTITTLRGRVSFYIFIRIRGAATEPSFEPSVKYIGEPEALIAAGCATAEMIAPGRRGSRRRDESGHRFRRWVFGKRVEIARDWPIDEIHLLPGIKRATVDALVRDQEDAWSEAMARVRKEEANTSHEVIADLLPVKSPDEWRRDGAYAVQFYCRALLEAYGGGPNSSSIKLDPAFRIHPDDARQYLECVRSASKALEAAIQSMRFERINAPTLRLVVSR